MPHSPRCQVAVLTGKRKMEVFEYNSVPVKPLSCIPMAHVVRKNYDSQSQKSHRWRSRISERRNNGIKFWIYIKRHEMCWACVWSMDFKINSNICYLLYRDFTLSRRKGYRFPHPPTPDTHTYPPARGAVAFPTGRSPAVAGLFTKESTASQATGTRSDLVSDLFLGKKERMTSHWAKTLEFETIFQINFFLSHVPGVWIRNLPSFNHLTTFFECLVCFRLHAEC